MMADKLKKEQLLNPLLFKRLKAEQEKALLLAETAEQQADGEGTERETTQTLRLFHSAPTTTRRDWDPSAVFPGPVKIDSARELSRAVKRPDTVKVPNKEISGISRPIRSYSSSSSV